MICWTPSSAASVCMVAAAALTACGDDPVVRFPTAGSSPTVAATPTAPLGQAASANTLAYTCNEGIPLIVIIDQTSGGATLTFSHDSFPYQQMTRVPAGSGARYSNGTYDLSMQGSEALLSYSNNGTVWDRCTRI